MIVCNPQNPTGNVWTEAELLRIGEMCLQNNVVVLSDEIHSDFVRPGHEYVPFARLPDKGIVDNSLSFNSGSKTFNMAGIPVTQGDVLAIVLRRVSGAGAVAPACAAVVF